MHRIKTDTERITPDDTITLHFQLNSEMFNKYSYFYQAVIILFTHPSRSTLITKLGLCLRCYVWMLKVAVIMLRKGNTVQFLRSFTNTDNSTLSYALESGLWITLQDHLDFQCWKQRCRERKQIYLQILLTVCRDLSN